MTAALVMSAAVLQAQQVPDRAFRPTIARPAYASGQGSRICVDHAHHNFHTIDERFWAFAELARRDGYRVVAWRTPFDSLALRSCAMLVISNAQPTDSSWNTYPTPTPSAFTPDEVTHVAAWVRNGGKLLLIADHMPLAGAASSLAAAFGARFTDGFAIEGAGARATVPQHLQTANKPTLFWSDSGSLRAHAITRGRDSTERVTQIRSFTGQAFQWTGEGVEPLMILPSNYVSLEPRFAWQFDSVTTRVRAVGGWLQGATRKVGAGRVAIFGEAAMFSAQVAGAQRNPVGMNAPMATQNPQFVLNVLHWLDGLIAP